MSRCTGKTIFFFCSMLVAGLLFERGTAMAEGISGAVELSQSTSDFKSTDASGLATSTKVITFFQRYGLSYDEMLYPYLDLKAGCNVDKTVSRGDTQATDSRIFPSASLTLNTPFVSSGVGYSRREEKAEAAGASPTTNINDMNNAFLVF